MARKTGHSCLFKIDDDNNGSYTTMGQVMTINGANVIDIGEVDATVLDDVLSPYMIPPTVNGYPPWVVTIAYDPNLASHVTLRSVSEARTIFAAQVVLANYATTKTLQCATGFISMFEMGEITSKGLMTCTVTYRPQAVPTFT